MTIEREEGLEFPWLLTLGLSVPAAVAIARRPAPAPTLLEPAPVAPPSLSPVPGLEPPLTPPEPLLTPAPLPSGFVREDVSAPPRQMAAAASRARVESAVREVAKVASVRQATAEVAARVEAQAKDLERKGFSAAKTAELTTRTLQRELQPAALAKQAEKSVRRFEDKARSAAQRLAKSGVSPREIERKAKDAAQDIRRDVEKKVDKATAPVRRAAEHIPAQIRQEAKRAIDRATQPIKREAKQAIDKATQPIRREVAQVGEQLLAPIRQQATAIGKQLGVGEATAAFNAQIKKMGLTGIPVVLPTDLSPAGIRDAAYNIGRKKAEELARSAGIPLPPLPTSVSSKAIKKWADDLVPDDARQAIEMGIDIGLSATTSAVSAMVTGAIGGSIVPGLGTVIGIGVALGVTALKGVVKEAITEKHAAQQLCKADENLFKRYSRDAAQMPKLSPLQMVPWVAQKSFDASKAVAEDQHKTKCGRTPYMTTLRMQGKYAFEYAKATIPVLGLPQTEQLIPLYERAPKKEWFWDTGRRQAGGAIVGGTGKVLLGPSAAGYDLTALLKLLYERKTRLQSLVARASRVEKLQPSELAPLRFELVTEIRNATALYAMDPSQLTEKWLKQLMGFLARLVRTEAAAVGSMKSRYEQDLRREAELRKQGKTGVVTGII